MYLLRFLNLLYSHRLRQGGEDELCWAPSNKGLFEWITTIKWENYFKRCFRSESELYQMFRYFYSVLVLHVGTLTSPGRVFGGVKSP